MDSCNQPKDLGERLGRIEEGIESIKRVLNTQLKGAEDDAQEALKISRDNTKDIEHLGRLINFGGALLVATIAAVATALFKIFVN